MRNPRRRNSPIERLRTAIECLPVATREAMLEGVLSSDRIIVGAYVDGQGGTCPMLAAHRAGARADFLSFARSWDRYAKAGDKPRAATQREVRILVSHLQASLEQTGGLDLDVAIAEHRALLSRNRRLARLAREARPSLPEAADPRGPIRARRLRRPLSRRRLARAVA